MTDADREARDELFVRYDKFRVALRTALEAGQRFDFERYGQDVSWDDVTLLRRLLEEAEVERDEAVAAGQEIARDLATALNARDRALRVVEAARGLIVRYAAAIISGDG